MFSHRLCDSSVVFWPHTCCDVALEWVYELHKQRDSAQVSVDDHLVLTSVKHLDQENWKLWVALCGSANAAARGDGRWWWWGVAYWKPFHCIAWHKASASQPTRWKIMAPPPSSSLPGDELCPKDKLQRWISIIVNLLRSFRGSGGVFEARDSSRLSLHQWSLKT